MTLARKLLRGRRRGRPPPAFLGHVGGDDFVVDLHSGPDPPADRRSAVSEFEAAADALYDEEDRTARYVSVKSRRDGVQDVGLVTVSVGVALSSRRGTTPTRASWSRTRAR